MRLADRTTAPVRGIGWDRRRKLWQGATGWNNPHLSLFFFFFPEDDRLPCPQRESPSKRKPWSFNRGRLQPLACPEQSLPLIGSNHLIRFFSLFLLPSAKFLHCVGNHLVWLIEQACSSFSLGLYIGHIISINGHKVDRY